MTLYKMRNLVYKWIDFSKFPNLSQNFGKNWLISLKILGRIGRIVYEGVTFFLKKWVFVSMGLLSNSVVAHPYQNQT